MGSEVDDIVAGFHRYGKCPLEIAGTCGGAHIQREIVTFRDYARALLLGKRIQRWSMVRVASRRPCVGEGKCTWTVDWVVERAGRSRGRRR